MPTPTDAQPAFDRPLNILAWAMAVAMFPLIFMGGLVTSHGAGLAVPDWPNSFGYNMFLLPLNRWVGRAEVFDVFLEHSHRLLGTVVGLFAILLVWRAWRIERRAGVRWLAMGILAAVIVQGILGGLRVVWQNLDLAVIHGCFAQATFAMAAVMVACTSRWWTSARPMGQAASAARNTAALYRLAVLTIAMIFLQLIAGAVMRHYMAGLAIPDLPLAYGKVLPPTSAADIAAANQWRRTAYPELGDVTLWQTWIHFAHRVGAILVTAAVGGLVYAVLRRHKARASLAQPARWLLGLTLLQFILGVLTVLWLRPKDLATVHVAVGALVLVAAVVIAARASLLRTHAEPDAALLTGQADSLGAQPA